jgi:hypothetical protein
MLSFQPDFAVIVLYWTTVSIMFRVENGDSFPQHWLPQQFDGRVHRAKYDASNLDTTQGLIFISFTNDFIEYCFVLYY